MNGRLVGSMLAALGENFADYEVYAANSADLVVVAVAEGRVPPAGPLPGKESVFMQELARLDIRRIEDVSARRVGSKREIAPLFATLRAPVNSDFRPIVQLEAPRARFEVAFARAIFSLVNAPLPILEMAGSSPRAYLRDPLPESDISPPVISQSVALELERGLTSSSADPLLVDNEFVRTALLTLKRRGALCGAKPPKAAIEKLHWAAEITAAHLAPKLGRALWTDISWLGCGAERLSPHVRDRLIIYAAIASRDARARRKAAGGARRGRRRLGTFPAAHGDARRARRGRARGSGSPLANLRQSALSRRRDPAARGVRLEPALSAHDRRTNP